MKKELILALVLGAGSIIPAAAQDKPPAPAPSPVEAGAASVARQTPLKVQVTFSRFLGEKKLGSTPYTLGVLSNAQKTSLRMGVQVPVVTTVFTNKSEGGASLPPSSYTYRDVGTNIDCQAQDAGNGLFNLTFTIENSSIHLDPDTASAEEKKGLRDVPAFRSFRSSFSIVLRDGQSMQYASATDPVSGEVLKIDVMLALAK